tara:strand:+ start:9876 stop:10409 length:534 start_codon:yes stop_codon:yes gene_type:complete
MKLTRVPQLTQRPAYHVNTDLWYLPDTIERYQEEYKLDIDPDFQRAHVWGEYKQIAFMEYLFKGGAMSNRLLFNYPNWMGSFESFKETMVLVDGKQRLEAMMKFKSNDLPVFGHTMDEWEDGKTACRRVSLEIYINDLKTRKEVLQWYIDLNSGGVVHTDEEIEKVKKMLKDEKNKS